MSEEDGVAQVCAVETSGTCKDSAHIILTTVDGSATSKPCLHGYSILIIN